MLINTCFDQKEFCYGEEGVFNKFVRGWGRGGGPRGGEG